MKDLCQLIKGNNIDTYKKRRKARKGSKLARKALEEAMGGESGINDDYESQVMENFDWDRDFISGDFDQYFD